MNEHIQVPKELLESLLNSVNGDFYMGKEWEESTVAQLRKHVAALASQAQQTESKILSFDDNGQLVDKSPAPEATLTTNREGN